MLAACASESCLQFFLACEVPELGRLSCTCKFLQSLLTENEPLGSSAGMAVTAWRAVCDRRSAQLSSRFQIFDDGPKKVEGRTWKQAYLDRETDLLRQKLRYDELYKLKWLFNFTRDAGGHGEASVRPARFRPIQSEESDHAILEVPGYPPLRLQLEDGERMQIEMFPVHFVHRLQSGEWLIANLNVRFVSYADEDAGKMRQWTAEDWERPPGLGPFKEEASDEEREGDDGHETQSSQDESSSNSATRNSARRDVVDERLTQTDLTSD